MLSPTVYIEVENETCKVVVVSVLVAILVSQEVLIGTVEFPIKLQGKMTKGWLILV